MARKLASLSKRLADRGVKLDISNEAIQWLGERGYDPQFGARPLRRVIQRELADELAMAIIAGGADRKVAKVDVDGDRLTVQLAR